MHRLRYIFFITLILLSSACSLNTIEPSNASISSATSEVETTTEAAASETEAATVDIVAETTSESTTAASSNNSTVSNRTETTSSIAAANCAVPSGWVIYRVVSGETLSLIAERVGETVESLTAANCLANPNQLEVNQEIYVPSRAIAVEADAGQVTFTASDLPINGGFYILAPNGNYTFYWAHVSSRATAVDFYLERLDGANNGIRTLIATDSNLVDGALIGWIVPERMSGILTAEARVGDRVIQRTANLTQFYTDPEPGDVGRVSVSPVVSDANSVLTLSAGQTVTLSWTGAQSAADTQVRFYFTDASANVTEIGVDYDMSDGASVQWLVPAGVRGTLSAIAGNGRVRYNSTEADVVVSS